ncbi:MAG: hypothetical protein AAF554_11330 [Bacteroidota bacterium]
MKNRLLCVLFLCLSCVLSWGQIKIGENPQSLDVFSVLELESTNRALVITRVNTAQMENMTPLRGALVYNTETQCIHFYDGINWINPCDQPDEQTFSAEAIVNANPTIIITEDPATSNFNFEVGKINGIESIVPSTVNGDLHIQQRSITTNQLADDSVTLDKLVNGTVPGQLLRWNGTNWELLDESALSVTELDGVIGNEVTNAADATLIRTGAGTDADPFVLDVNTNGIDTNELADLAVTNAKINDDAITTDKILDNDIGTDDLANTSITTLKIADDAVTRDQIDANVAGTGLNQAADGSLEIDVAAINGDGTLGSLAGTIAITGTPVNALFEDVNIEVATDAITNVEMADDAVDTNEIRDDAVTNIKLGNNAVSTVKIQDDAITRDKIAPNVAGTGLVQAADGSLQVDVGALNGDGTLSSPTGTIAFTGTPVNALFENVGVDVADNSITNAKMTNDAINTDELVDDAVTPAKLANGTATGQILQWDGTNWQLVDDSTLTITEQDAIVGNEVEDATDATLTRAGSGTAADPYTLDVSVGGIDTNELANDAITNIKMADDAVDTNEIVDNAVTNAKLDDDSVNTDELVDDAVTPDKLANGTAAGQLLQWDGADWQLVDDSALTITEQDAIVGNEVEDATDATLTRAGSGTDADPYTLDVSVGGIDTDELANDAVTNIKIADDAVNTNEIVDDAVTNAKLDDDAVNTDELVDDAVTPAKLANGTAVGQLLRWDGADWQLVLESTINDEVALSAIVPAVPNAGSSGFYTINNVAITATTIIQLTVQENTPGNPIMIQLTNQAAGTFSVQVYEFLVGVPTPADALWHYTVVNP